MRPNHYRCVAIAMVAPVMCSIAQAAKIVASQTITLDGPDWRLAKDGANKGREEKWFEAPRAEAKPTHVPWVIQNIFPGYHGVAWYWRKFEAPANPHPGGRYLLRFEAVDYLAEVWVNGRSVGGHEGGETPFTIDVTDAVRAGQENLLAVRVLNPTGHPIDGFTLKETPSGMKSGSIGSNMLCNSGGIVGAVELLMVPAIRIADLQALPDWKRGDIRIRAALNNAAAPADAVAQFSVAPAAGGPPIAATDRTARVETGKGLLEVTLRVPNHRLWTLEDPALYRIAASIQAAGSTSMDRQSVRCGFRDFRFENGYFRLNGRRIFLKGAFYHVHFPITHVLPHDPELLRRDVAYLKKAGYNLVRIAIRSAPSRMLGLCDEAGVLAYQEHYGSWQLQDSPAMTSRWNGTISEVVLRDRNHPSLVIFGLLNETGNNARFHLAVTSLPMIRELDPTRLVLLNSGRWDHHSEIGSLSNPGSVVWEGKMSDLPDIHTYPLSPLSQKSLDALRTCGKGGRALVSEFGYCGVMDLPSELSQFKRLGQEHGDDARWYRKMMDEFMADWKRWRLDEIWKRPEDYFADGHRNYARIKEPGETALRSNPWLAAYISTHMTQDGNYAGCGLTTLFREPKDPSLFDGARLANVPLRWCLFAAPNNVYRGSRVRVEAVLADEDTLRPGVYPARVEVLSPDRRAVATREIQVRIEDSAQGREQPFTVACFDETIPVDGPAGSYEFVVTMPDRQEIPGGRLNFYVDDPGAMPAMPQEVTCWGDDAALTGWLTGHGVKVLPFDASVARRQVIVVGAKPPAPGGAEAFAGLARQIARGSAVVFLGHAVFAEGKENARWLPLATKRIARAEPFGFYRSERWTKRHPVFQDLPAGGMMDYGFYGSLISNELIASAEELGKPSASGPKLVEVVCGGTRSSTYATSSGLHVAVYELGAGRFILNTLNIKPNLEAHPAAGRMLRNMLNYAVRDLDKPLAELPADFDAQLKAMGYE